MPSISLPHAGRAPGNVRPIAPLHDDNLPAMNSSLNLFHLRTSTPRDSHCRSPGRCGIVLGISTLRPPKTENSRLQEATSWPPLPRSIVSHFPAITSFIAGEIPPNSAHLVFLIS
ncbi:hypothetical protein CDEST_11300 [Colletotrichum destructivum]|uniref:Uncharacterized protein n=1 Tax=Colletotrichum destructivum TaxID=34406 RepID=A0AAX4ISQ8_9PEZI|nr:hypothetical protein CDEST_11300 [Colletotrichum destructivum]